MATATALPFNFATYAQLLQLDFTRIPHFPHPKQAELLLRPQREILYGGAAGGGKSDALLMAASQYVHVPGYSALLVRRTYADLAKTGAIMDRAQSWWRGKPGVHWDNTNKIFTFDDKGRISFGYLANKNDELNFGSAEYQYIGIDEAGQLRQAFLRFLASRLRRVQGMPVPLRMHYATNPIGEGFAYLKRRFIQPETRVPGAVFIRSFLEDNPSLDTEEYLQSLSLLDSVTYKKLRYGDVDIEESGGYFARADFQRIRRADVPLDTRKCRSWDLASSVPSEHNADPDYTVGVRIEEKDGRFFVTDVRRDRADPYGVERMLVACAQDDGPEVPVYIEREGGSSGKITLDHYQRHLLPGYSVSGDRATGAKETRAAPWSAAVRNHLVWVVDAPWTEEYLDEHVGFPYGAHDDQVDGSANGHKELAYSVRAW